jgi:hypothetical protein
VIASTQTTNAVLNWTDARVTFVDDDEGNAITA